MRVDLVRSIFEREDFLLMELAQAHEPKAKVREVRWKSYVFSAIKLNAW